MIKTLMLLAFFCVFALPVQAAEYITLASTTSTQNSGLFDHILAMFTKKTAIEVRVVAVGTGQAIRNAKRGDADVLLVHHRTSEDAFVKDGFGVKRYDLMKNDFVLVGPKLLKNSPNIAEALQAIASSKSLFVSRGDDSGTHKRERSLWKSQPSGPWYREAGAGMGATLNMAQAMGAYTLTDRGTWVAFKNKGDLRIVVDGGDGMDNPYGVILVNPVKYPHIKAKAGQAFIDWLVSAQGQSAIASFKLNGQQLFFPTAKP